MASIGAKLGALAAAGALIATTAIPALLAVAPTAAYREMT